MTSLYGFPHGSSSTTSSNSVQHYLLLRLIALVSLDRANLNVSSNSGKVGFPLALCDSLLVLWHSARSCAILSLYQWTAVCGFPFPFLGMVASQEFATFRMTSSTFSSAINPSAQLSSMLARIAPVSKALAFQPLNFFFRDCDYRFLGLCCRRILQVMARWSLCV